MNNICIPCDICSHQNVCKYKDNAMIYVKNIENSTKGNSPISMFEIAVKCMNFDKKKITYRGYATESISFYPYKYFVRYG